MEAESLLTLPKYIVLFSCFASLFAVDFYSSCKKEEFLYDFHNITVRYQFVQKIFIFIIGVFDTMIFIIKGITIMFLTMKISTESLFLGIKWILYLVILILCKNDLVGFFFFRKRKLSLLKWQSNFIHFQLLSTTFWSLEVYKRKFFRIFLYSTIHLKVFQTYLLVMTFTTIALGPYGFVISKNRSMNDALYFFVFPDSYLFSILYNPPESFQTYLLAMTFNVVLYYDIIILC